MNRITRLLAIAGMGVGAAIALAGPAQAAASSTTHQAPATTKAHWGDEDRIVGFFGSPFTCNRVGRLGEIRDRWDDYDCYRVRFGFHRGDWALSVSENDWNGPHRPFGFPGGPFHGGPFGGPFDGPHRGPIGGPFGGPHRGPIGGPIGGPIVGPIGGPIGGPVVGPIGGPIGGPVVGPIGGPFGGPFGGPRAGR